MAMFDDCLANDEQVEQRVAADYSLIAPKSGNRASGLDGVITSSTPWTLASATVNFAARGVESGQVVRLLIDDGDGDKDEDRLAVASASGHSVNLRRIGESAGIGQPPGPATGSHTGVIFEIKTFRPQILNATNEVVERLGLTGTSIADLKAGDHAETLENAVASLAAAKAYRAAATEGSASLGGAARATGSSFWAKYQDLKAESDALVSLLLTYYYPPTSAATAANRPRRGALGGRAVPYPERLPRYGVDSEWGDTSNIPDRW